VIDSRREASHIGREFTRYHATVGEAVLWFCFDTQTSQYDTVYDEGYRRYEAARRVPVLWVDQQEAVADYGAEGRRPTQRIRFACGARQLMESGIPVNEAHGLRVSDTQLSPVWSDDRINDIVYYDGRFFAVSSFQIRGRLQGEDVIIGVAGVETQPSDELNIDATPLAWFPAPPISDGDVTQDTGVRVTYGPSEPSNPSVGDLWLDTDG
jgi:hypothetical protein